MTDAGQANAEIAAQNQAAAQSTAPVSFLESIGHKLHAEANEAKDDLHRVFMRIGIFTDELECLTRYIEARTRLAVHDLVVDINAQSSAPPVADQKKNDQVPPLHENILTPIQEKIMSALTEQMAALGKLIAATNGAPDLTAVHNAITTLQSHDAAQDEEIADTIAGLQALHDAAIPADTAGTPTPPAETGAGEAA